MPTFEQPPAYTETRGWGLNAGWTLTDGWGPIMVRYALGDVAALRERDERLREAYSGLHERRDRG